ncbi:MAG: hypothetical protein GX617_12840 [Lentisphaerae bacterium]|nr:hypothetical protein [Lentisphaerota bacterium]
MMRTNAGTWMRVFFWCFCMIFGVLPSFPLAAQDQDVPAKATPPALLVQPSATPARRADDDWFFIEYEVDPDTGTATVSSYFGIGDVVIPDQDPDGHPVTAIAPDLFSANPFIDSVSFPPQISFAADQLEQYFLDSYNLTALFFRGPAPAYLPTVSGRCVIYYPYNADAGTSNPETTWAYRIAHDYPATRRYLPIAYPITAPPVITRSASEPDENPDCFTDNLTIALSAEEGSVVRYTTDGTTPLANSASSSPVTIATSTLLEARAFRDIAGVLQPGSAIARRHFVNTNELRNALAAVPTGVNVPMSLGMHARPPSPMATPARPPARAPCSQASLPSSRRPSPSPAAANCPSTCAPATMNGSNTRKYMHSTPASTSVSNTSSPISTTAGSISPVFSRREKTR